MLGRENAMEVHCRTIVVLICVGWLSLTSAHDFDSSHYPSHDVITRDFCIIGGGGSGTYAAIRLHDMGKSVVVVERKNRLGGNTETYIDPATQIPIDIGVVEWNDLDVVRNYLTRLNVSFMSVNNTLPVPTYVDLRSGEVVTTFVQPDPTAALQEYGAQLAKYPYLSLGFDLPSPVPEDLLLPFGDFVTKYGLQDVVYLISIFGEGIGDLLRQPTLYVMKLIGLDVLQSLQTGFLVTANGDNSEVYQKATAILAGDVLLSSRVIATDRSCDDGYAKVLVKTADGVVKLIQAENIIISIPPKLNNLVGFDLTAKELALFAQFGNAAFYTGLLHHIGINDTQSIQNVVADNSTYGLPHLPAPYGFAPTRVPGLASVLYGSPYTLPDERVKSDIIAAVKRMQAAGTLPPTPTPTFAVFSGHVPFELTVSTSAIADGFYGKLYTLQGQARTYYIGAAFHSQDSALLWRFTEGLLPTILGNSTG